MQDNNNKRVHNTDGPTNNNNKQTRFHNALEAKIIDNPTGDRMDTICEEMKHIWNEWGLNGYSSQVWKTLLLMMLLYIIQLGPLVGLLLTIIIQTANTNERIRTYQRQRCKLNLIDKILGNAHYIMNQIQKSIITFAMGYLPTISRSSGNIKHKHKWGSRLRGRLLLLGSLITMVSNMAMDTTIAFPRKMNNLSNRISTTTLDIESKVIGIYNRASCCISRNRGDFIGTLTNYSVTICGYAGDTTRNLQKGTIRWKWVDDAGRVHKFMIPNSIYDPRGHKILDPQHWAKHCGGKGAGRTPTADNVTLFWGNNKYTIKRQTFTWIPPGMRINGNPRDYCLELHQHLYEKSWQDMAPLPACKAGEDWIQPEWTRTMCTLPRRVYLRPLHWRYPPIWN